MNFSKTERKLFTIVGALTIVGLTACAGALPTQTAPLAAPTTHTSITLRFWHTKSGIAATTLSALADDFHKAYPNITVRAEQKASEGDLLREGLGAMALNQTPDFIIASKRTIAEFARKGALVNLDVLAGEVEQGLSETDRNDFLPGLLDAGRLPDLKNQWYAFPFDKNAVVLYYNADLLQAAKADVPPRTWDQFGNAARVTTKGNVHGWVMSPSAATFAAIQFSRGSSVLNATQTQAQFGDDAGLKSLQLIVALKNGDAAYLAPSADAARSDFAQAKTALLFGTTDDLTAIADSVAHAGNFKWGVANIPQINPAQAATTVLGSDLAIFRPVGNASEKQVQAAWLFARWLVLPEQSARWTRATLSIPVRVSAQSLLASNLPPNFQRLSDGWSNGLPTLKAMPAVKDANLIDTAIVEMWINIANGYDPATALKNATTRVNRVLGQIP